MGRPRHDASAVATTTRILEAAIVAFARQGFHGAALADIAAVAGITRPSLLYHFQSKEQLYVAALGAVFADIDALIALATGPAHDDVAGTVAGARLMGLIEDFATFAAARPDTTRLLLRAIVADDDPTTRTLLAAHAGPTIDRVEDFARRAGAAPGGLRRALMMIIVDTLACAAAGDVAPTLWGPDSALGPAARLLFPHSPFPHHPPMTGSPT
jgi:AcrR family transcriptional regulator